jgi:hypothetical protein
LTLTIEPKHKTYRRMTNAIPTSPIAVKAAPATKVAEGPMISQSSSYQTRQQKRDSAHNSENQG